MRNVIENELDLLSAVRDVNVLVAVESGSRAWGIASRDSDYDVRFVYVRPVDEYLRLKETRDTMNWRLDETLDIVGWDLQKLMRLLRGSNPTVFEWLSSPTVYRESDSFEAVREIAAKCFSPKASAFHYVGMARGELKRISRDNTVSIKIYLYAIRAILAARWTLDEGVPAPMLLDDLVSAKLEADMVPMLEGLVKAKASTADKATISRCGALDLWIESEIEKLTKRSRVLPSLKRVPWEELDKVFLSIVKGCC